MSGYYYKKTEPRLWTVGHDNQHGRWEAESDHRSKEEAARRVHFLNGGGSNEQLALGIMAAILASHPDCNDVVEAVGKAREIMATIYGTTPE